MDKSLKPFLIFLCSLFLFACAGAPKRQISTPQSRVVEDVQPDPQKQYSEEDLILMAKGSKGRVRLEWLLQLAQHYVKRQSPQKAVKLLKSLPDIQNYPRLLEETHQHIGVICFNQQQLACASHYLLEKPLPTPLPKDVMEIQYQLLLQEKLYPEAAMSLATLMALAKGPEKEHYAEQLWEKIQLALSANPLWRPDRRSILRPWVELATSINEVAKNESLVHNAILQWRAKYSDHFAQTWLPQALLSANSRTNFDPKHIAVVLPFTGRLQEQGYSIKKGLLAAHFKDQHQSKLTFIDANQPDEVIVSQLSSSGADFLIGPLTKEKVESLATLLPESLPMLALNRLDDIQSVRQTQFFFSLAPEDESAQAARDLFKQGYRHPVVIAHQGPISQRMVEAFSQSWSDDTGQIPEVAFFDSQQDMQNIVRSVLDVQHSYSRVAKARSMTNRKVQNVYRSRRDVDMIYIIANVANTRLLKPYVDVNVSPFAKIIPIFATSRSFQNDADQTIMRDLNTLNFTDTPLLIADDSQFKAAIQTIETLWPESNARNKRLFAFGFDALNLISYINRMQGFPSYRYSGFTGHITMGQNNTLYRNLDWAYYTRDKVIYVGKLSKKDN